MCRDIGTGEPEGPWPPNFLQTMQKCPFEAQNGRGNVLLLGLGPHFLDASQIPVGDGAISSYTKLGAINIPRGIITFGFYLSINRTPVSC